MTVNRYGKGEAWYLAGRLDVRSLTAIYRHFIDCSNLESLMDLVESRSGTVNLQLRKGDSQSYLFLMNFSAEQGSVVLKDSWEDVLNPGITGREWPLRAWGVKVLCSQEKTAGAAAQ